VLCSWWLSSHAGARRVQVSPSNQQQSEIFNCFVSLTFCFRGSLNWCG
jgi:hypothetical protein